MSSKAHAKVHPVEGRRAQRKQETRARLLAAGRQLFGTHGLYDSRIEDLTSVAGIAKGTIYGYFADKEALVHAVVAQAFDELLAYVNESVADSHSANHRVERAARAHLEFFDRNPDFMRVLHQVRGLLKFSRPEWRPLRLCLERYLTRLATALQRRRKVGAPPSRAQLTSARMIFGAVSGIASVRAALELDLGDRTFQSSSARGIAALVAKGTPRSSRDQRSTRPQPPRVSTRVSGVPSARAARAGMGAR